MLKIALALAALMVPVQAISQDLRTLVVPPKGELKTASVGSTVYERSQYRAFPSYRIASAVVAKILFAQVDLPAGTELLQIDSKTKLKACAATSIGAFRLGEYNGCLMDDDGDGKFDRVAGNEVQGGKKLPVPVEYSPSEYIDTAPGSLKQVLIYLGSTRDTLRLSYREFVNDMARPAFTEEYTFPLEATFPQVIAFKDVKLTVTKIDGAGLHYSVE